MLTESVTAADKVNLICLGRHQNDFGERSMKLIMTASLYFRPLDITISKLYVAAQEQFAWIYYFCMYDICHISPQRRLRVNSACEKSNSCAFEIFGRLIE